MTNLATGRDFTAAGGSTANRSPLMTRRSSLWGLAASLAAILPLGCLAVTLCGGRSEPVPVDLAKGPRMAARTEVLTYSARWSGDAPADARAVITIDGEPFSAETGSGVVSWTPSRNGTYVLTHQVMAGGSLVGETLTATFAVAGLPDGGGGSSSGGGVVIDMPEEPVPVEPIPEEPVPVDPLPEEPVPVEPEPQGLPSVIDEVAGEPDVEKAAVTYNGYVYDEQADAVVGSIQAKAAKAKKNKKTGAFTSKLSVGVQLVGEARKVSFSGTYDLENSEPQSFMTKGRTITLKLGENGMTGVFEGYAVAGVPERRPAAPYVGTYNIFSGEGTFTVAISAKGAAKVTGTLASGKSVSASAAAVVGEQVVCVPVVMPKYLLAFSVWHDGEAVSVDGLDNAVVGAAGVLAGEAAFSVDAAALSEILGDETYAAYYPTAVPVTPKGARWVVAGGVRAGKVVLKKDGGVDADKAGANPSALKLTYTANKGSFKGSFAAYVENRGKPKAVTFTVTGILVDGVGYGTATAKKYGSVPVEIR